LLSHVTENAGILVGQLPAVLYGRWFGVTPVENVLPLQLPRHLLSGIRAIVQLKDAQVTSIMLRRARRRSWR